MSGIIEAVGRLDFATFQLLRLYHWPALDIVMASLSDIAAGAGIWVALTLLIGLIHPRRWPAAIQVLLAIALTIIVTESVVKPLVNRRRPFESYADTRVYGFRSTTPSFPSGHAANAAAAAYALTRLAPEGRAIFWLIALLISFSRIYLGVHYPTDVIGGALMGLAVAMVCRWRYAVELCRIGRSEDWQIEGLGRRRGAQIFVAARVRKARAKATTRSNLRRNYAWKRVCARSEPRARLAAGLTPSSFEPAQDATIVGDRKTVQRGFELFDFQHFPRKMRASAGTGVPDLPETISIIIPAVYSYAIWRNGECGLPSFGLFSTCSSLAYLTWRNEQTDQVNYKYEVKAHLAKV